MDGLILKGHLDVIDMAQRSGTIRTINLPAVVAAQNVNKGFYKGGYSSQPNGSSAASISINENSNDVLVQLIAANTSMIQQLNSRLEKGIEARMSNERFDFDRAIWDAQKRDIARS